MGWTWNSERVLCATEAYVKCNPGWRAKTAKTFLEEESPQAKNIFKFYY